MAVVKQYTLDDLRAVQDKQRDPDTKYNDIATLTATLGNAVELLATATLQKAEGNVDAKGAEDADTSTDSAASTGTKKSK